MVEKLALSYDRASSTYQLQNLLIFGRARRELRDFIQDAVYKPARVSGAEALRQLDRLIDRDFRRGGGVQEFVGAEPQDRAVHGIDPLGSEVFHDSGEGFVDGLFFQKKKKM